MAAIGYGVAALVDGETLAGVSFIGMGVAAIGYGVAGLVEGQTMGVAVIGLGVALIGFGVAGLRSSKLMSTISALTRDPEKRDCGP